MKGLFKHFKQFSKIRKIKLSKVNNDDLEDIIDGIGAQIFHMELVCIRGTLDLVPIATKCSQLKILENKANNKNLSATGSPTREFTDDIHQIDADSIHVEESDEPSVLDRVGIWIEVQ